MMTMTSIAPWLAAGMIVAAVGVMGDQDTARQRQPKPDDQKAEPKERAQPREPAPQRRPPENEPEGRATPRTEPPPPAAAPRRDPPPRAVPPRYYGVPRVYYFPPVSLHRGYYYHPYFGFYYGPYYGPFYPFPGPFQRTLPFSTCAIRTRVKPVDTQVYVNGYFAGIVDDFDGVFQRLYVPAGQLDLEFHLDGYRSHRQKVYAAPGDTLEITHHMEKLRPGEPNEPVSRPQPVDPEWTVTGSPNDDRPASPFGILAIGVDPPDAHIFVDDEAWVVMEGRNELVLHVEAGWHRLEIRKEGYQTFRTDVELSAGATSRLNVTLQR
jgi:hypothetical protein